MKPIYIVYGRTGQYSDRTEWNVCAYLTENLAKRHAELAQTEADHIEAHRPDRYDSEGMTNKWDSQMRMDYTGTSYNYTMVEVFDELMQFGG